MRWWVVLIMVIIAVGLDTGLAGVFTIRGIGHATPSFSAWGYHGTFSQIWRYLHPQSVFSSFLPWSISI